MPSTMSADAFCATAAHGWVGVRILRERGTRTSRSVDLFELGNSRAGQACEGGRTLTDMVVVGGPPRAR